jgi:hypothetical protein
MGKARSSGKWENATDPRGDLAPGAARGRSERGIDTGGAFQASSHGRGGMWARTCTGEWRRRENPSRWGGGGRGGGQDTRAKRRRTRCRGLYGGQLGPARFNGGDVGREDRRWGHVDMWVHCPFVDRAARLRSLAFDTGRYWCRNVFFSPFQKN